MANTNIDTTNEAKTETITNTNPHALIEHNTTTMYEYYTWRTRTYTPLTHTHTDRQHTTHTHNKVKAGTTTIANSQTTIMPHTTRNTTITTRSTTNTHDGANTRATCTPTDKGTANDKARAIDNTYTTAKPWIGALHRTNPNTRTKTNPDNITECEACDEYDWIYQA